LLSVTVKRRRSHTARKCTMRSHKETGCTREPGPDETASHQCPTASLSTKVSR
jgi:hypothetical protein